MPKVSVIIPIYNVDKYLKQCLDSVVNQTLKDIEIICIDDCSSDNSLNILKEYAKNDNRIKIIEQTTNQGQGVARNEAIKIATGEYIGFVDPDDWIESDMYEKMYNKSKEFDTDIVICNILLFFHNSTETKIINTLKDIKKLNNNINSNVIYNFDNLHKYFLEATNNFSVCRIYKTSFLKEYNIRFDTTRVGEDKLFCGLAKLLAKRIVHIDREFYHYRKHRKTDFIKNEYQAKMSLNLISEIYKYNPDKDLEYGINNHLSMMCTRQYSKLNNVDRNDFYKDSKYYLPYNAFIQFRKRVFIYHLKQIPRMILSTKNIIEEGRNNKYLYLLGFKFKLSQKSQSLVAVERE